MSWTKIIVLTGFAGLCFLLLVLGIIEKSTVMIGLDERGVVLSPYEPAGYRYQILRPGRNWLRPGEKAVIYSISPEAYRTSNDAENPQTIQAIAKGGEEMWVDVSAIYAINPEKLLDLHICWQDRYRDGLVRPLIRGTTRNVLSGYTANEIKVKRSFLEYKIFEALGQEFAENDLILFEFRITGIQ